LGRSPIPAHAVSARHHRRGDAPISDDTLAQIGALLPKGSEATRIQDAGHFLIVEQPGQVNSRVIQFLEAPV
jgi:pimeloyl-ACP methyl ester carboxylesterase